MKILLFFVSLFVFVFSYSMRDEDSVFIKELSVYKNDLLKSGVNDIKVDCNNEVPVVFFSYLDSEGITRNRSIDLSVNYCRNSLYVNYLRLDNGVYEYNIDSGNVINPKNFFGEVTKRDLEVLSGGMNELFSLVLKSGLN